MIDNKIANAFNEWMNRFIQNPEQFQREFQTVTEYLNEQNNGIEPTYGEAAAAYLDKLLDELN